MIGPVSRTLDLSCSGDRHAIDCTGIDVAGLQSFVTEPVTGSYVLTVKGTIDGVNWVSLGEADISADGIYGPFNVRGLARICCEVTTTATVGKAVTTWLGRGCG